jgi:hypothetical protein
MVWREWWSAASGVSGWSGGRGAGVEGAVGGGAAGFEGGAQEGAVGGEAAHLGRVGRRADGEHRGMSGWDGAES